jgi:hypothetical protein
MLALLAGLAPDAPAQKHFPDAPVLHPEQAAAF